MTAAAEAITVWTPPGASYATPEQEPLVAAVFAQLFGSRAEVQRPPVTVHENRYQPRAAQAHRGLFGDEGDQEAKASRVATAERTVAMRSHRRMPG